MLNKYFESERNEVFSKTPEPERVAIILFQWSQQFLEQIICWIFL